MRKPSKQVIRAIQKRKLLSALLLFICLIGIVLLVLTKTNLLNSVLPSGWIYTWESEIPIHNTMPKDFGGFTVSRDAIDVSLMNGAYYHLNQNGKILWSFDMQDYSIYPPVTDDDTMYISGFDGRLYALDKRTGEEKWRFNTPGYLKSDTEPQISGELVLFGGRNGILYALNKHTGALVWQFKTTPIDRTRMIWGETIIHFGRFTTDSTTVYVNSATDNTLYALDSSTGAIRWSLPGYGFTFLKPTVFAHSVSIWSNDGSYILVDKKSGNILMKVTATQNHIVEDKDRIYLTTPDNSINAIDATSGVSIWTYQSDRGKPQTVQVADSTHIVILEYYDTKPYITAVNRSSGKKLWTSAVPFENIFFVKTDTQYVYVIGKAAQSALRLTDGVEVWSSTVANATRDAIVTQFGIYIISENKPDIQISYLTKSTGNIRWQFSWSNINTNYIREANGNLYFITKDSRSIVMLNKNSPYKQITLSRLQTIVRPTVQMSDIVHGIKPLWARLSQIIQGKTNPVLIDLPQQPILKNSIYEITITHNDSLYQNKQREVELQGNFISPQGKAYQIKGFYYDKNTWKMRFAPDQTGIWTWSIHIHGPYITEDKHGTFTVVDSQHEGFLKISPSDPHKFVTGGQTVFYPIGIQDCIEDKNQDGDPLDQWFPGITNYPTYASKITPAYSMDLYLSIYANSGFNLWRWGAGNCSYVLWLQMSPDGNRYGLNQGMQTDTLFQALKNHNYHIWMTLLSFTSPFKDTTSTKDRFSMLKDYIDYVVARYAAYVDVWELGNEMYFDNQTLEFMSSYIHSIDPYQHPVTTNWERPDEKNITITSLHLYDAECNIFCDKNLAIQIAKYTNLTKPIVFSELGNRNASWDDTSAERMRVRLWLGYMQNISMIFWNNSISYFMSGAGTSNIYLGPIERTYISILKSIVRQSDIDMKPIPIQSQTDGIKIFAQGSKKFTLVYLYQRILDPEYTSATFQITLSGNGLAKWIDPQTGQILSQYAVNSGNQTLTSPAFGTDLVLFITYN